MESTSFVISGGDFRRTEGCLSLVELLDTGELVLRDEVWIAHPEPRMAVVGKGLTGLCLEGRTAWTCFSNLIVRLTLPSGSIADSLSDPAFNDLHQLTLDGKCLLVANTGNETVDTISPDHGLVSRLDLLGDGLRALRPQRLQTQETEPRLHHLVSAVRNPGGELLIGLGRQARILNTTSWQWVGPRFPAPIHDVQCYEDAAVWCTSVDGGIHCVEPDGSVRSRALKDYLRGVGWTRGLAVIDSGVLVGTTAIRATNRDYYRMLSGNVAGQVGTSLTWISQDGSQVSTLPLPDAAHRKIFSICPIAGP